MAQIQCQRDGAVPDISTMATDIVPPDVLIIVSLSFDVKNDGKYTVVKAVLHLHTLTLMTQHSKTDGGDFDFTCLVSCQRFANGAKSMQVVNLVAYLAPSRHHLWLLLTWKERNSAWRSNEKVMSGMAWSVMTEELRPAVPSVV